MHQRAGQGFHRLVMRHLESGVSCGGSVVMARIVSLYDRCTLSTQLVAMSQSVPRAMLSQRQDQQDAALCHGLTSCIVAFKNCPVRFSFSGPTACSAPLPNTLSQNPEADQLAARPWVHTSSVMLGTAGSTSFLHPQMRLHISWRPRATLHAGSGRAAVCTGLYWECPAILCWDAYRARWTAVEVVTRAAQRQAAPLGPSH